MKKLFNRTYWILLDLTAIVIGSFLIGIHIDVSVGIGVACIALLFIIHREFD